MLSLFEFLTQNRKFSQILRRVSPPLVGAVLLCLPLQVSAETYKVDGAILNVLGSGWVATDHYVVNSDPLNSHRIEAVYDETFIIRLMYDKIPQQQYVTLIDGPDLTFDVSVPSSYAADVSFFNVDSWTLLEGYLLCTDGSRYDVIVTACSATRLTSTSYRLRMYVEFVNSVVPVSPYTYRIGDLYLKVQAKTNMFISGYDKYPALNLNRGNFSVRYPIQVLENYTPNGSAIEQSILDELKKGNEQDKEFHDEEIEEAKKVGSQIEGFASNLESTVRSKWAILFYPIEFTTDLLSVFTDGTSSAVYRDSYSSVSGYRYDEDVGFIVPVLASSRADPDDVVDVPSGTVLHFPGYTLPVLDVELWEGFGYDLADLPDQFPFLFNSLYVIETILMFWWLVGFLRDKYEEVFG